MEKDKSKEYSGSSNPVGDDFPIESSPFKSIPLLADSKVTQNKEDPTCRFITEESEDSGSGLLKLSIHENVFPIHQPTPPLKPKTMPGWLYRGRQEKRREKSEGNMTELAWGVFDDCCIFLSSLIFDLSFLGVFDDCWIFDDWPKNFEMEGQKKGNKVTMIVHDPNSSADAGKIFTPYSFKGPQPQVVRPSSETVAKPLFSSFASVWDPLFGWVSASSLAYIYGKDEVLSVNGKKYLPKIAAISEIKETVSRGLATALPRVASELSLPNDISELENELGRLLETMSLSGAVESFGTEEWLLTVLLFLDALSVSRLPGITSYVCNRSKILEESGVGSEEYEMMKEILLPV